jgi:hypothetical protein
MPRRPRWARNLFDRHELAPAQGPPTQGAPRLTVEEMALRQVFAEPERDENEIRELYGLRPLSEREIAEWVA